MGLESGSFIPDLVDSNPTGTDPKSQGDDHLRLIKTCTQGSFPAFVGTQAIPKFVSYTEDELSDAALKSAIQTILAEWDFDADIRLLDTRRLIVRNDADTDDLALVGRSNTSDVLLFGDGNSANSQYFANLSGTAHRFFSGGTEYGRVGSNGIQGADDQGAFQDMGFLRPPLVSENASFTVDITLHRGVVIQLGAPGNFTVTIPVLQGQMTWTMTNRSGADITIAASGTTIEFLAGGSSISAPLTMANNSVVQCYMVNSSFCSVWGNGIS